MEDIEEQLIKRKNNIWYFFDEKRGRWMNQYEMQIRLFFMKILINFFQIYFKYKNHGKQ